MEEHDELYLMSLAAGILVGVIYRCMNVRSPASLVALVGLLGIFIGEQIVQVSKKLLREPSNASRLASSWVSVRPPSSVVVTPRRPTIQASAIWASVWSASIAILAISYAISRPRSESEPLAPRRRHLRESKHPSASISHIGLAGMDKWTIGKASSYVFVLSGA